MNSGQIFFFSIITKISDNSAQWRSCGGWVRRVLKPPKRQSAEGGKINILNEKLIFCPKHILNY
jgi:hypothetical protein